MSVAIKLRVDFAWRLKLVKSIAVIPAQWSLQTVYPDAKKDHRSDNLVAFSC